MLDRLLSQVLAERWARLPVGPGDEFEGVAPIYWVSTEGRVLAICPRASGAQVVLKSARPEIRPRRRPHARVNLKLPGFRKYRTARLHRVVLAAFGLRADAEGSLGLHKNGNPLDNRLSNLRYGTFSENLQDQYTHGSRTWGKACEGCLSVCPWCTLPASP